MQNEIMDAVTRRLFELFGDGYAIYTDEVEQGLDEPCFFVSFLEPSEKPLLGRRFLRSYDMCIQYFPKSGQPSRELNSVSDRLIDGLEYITLQDGCLKRGKERSSKVSDGVLTFLVTYEIFGVKPAAEAERMEELTMKGVCG